MKKIVNWDNIDASSWTYDFANKECSYLIYELDRLPDFTEPRFDYLCKEPDNRQIEVVKKQMMMLRQFHGLGSNWGISMRLVKKDFSIILYLVFRCASYQFLSDEEISAADFKIRNALLQNEYSFKRIENNIENILWVNEIAEITKNEMEYQSDRYPDGSHQDFYVPYMWTNTENSMENICNALLSHKGRAIIDVTIVPSQYLKTEQNWMNGNINYLKECMNGETIRSKESGKVLWQGKKLPILKTPVDNCEKMNKQYETSRIFLSSVRVLSDSNAEILANAFLVNSVKNEGSIQVIKKGSEKFDYLLSCYVNVDISADVHTAYWNDHDGPYRAQRFSRLNCLEEISNFFRIPVPIKPGFPGFGYDTGLGEIGKPKSERSIINLGVYLDDKNTSTVQFDSQQLAKHGLIVGVPGSGKTTAMFNILYQLWKQPENQKIPFIVLEPAKTEYRALKQLDVFKEEMLVFTLGDEGVSPFRFNPMEVLPGIKIESHISRLQACFVGAFDLFDPLPIFLEQAIRQTYLEKGWYEDSVGGEDGLETPTLSDLCRNAAYIISHSGFDSKMRSDFQASLLERLNSLRRGSKGRMLDTPRTIPMEDLMGRPIIMELDSLNGDEKSLMMMFLLSYVYEYCKVKRKSGSPLKHMLLVEEAHNLIGAQGSGSDNRANPKAQTIELFVNMLAEMRALGQGILIADQLPTAIAPQAVKQTNVKILMRVTAKDDREEIGNTMDLNDEQMHQVVNFKTGHAYFYHEGEDRVRAIRMLNFKGEHDVEEPPTDEELKSIMCGYELEHVDLYMPYPECKNYCSICDRRVRNQVESFLNQKIVNPHQDIYVTAFPKAEAKQLEGFRKTLGICGIGLLLTKREIERIRQRYSHVGDSFGVCAYIHILNEAKVQMHQCRCKQRKCTCNQNERLEYLKKYEKLKEM